MASTSVATPPSSPRKSSFSSLRLSPIKHLNLLKRNLRDDGDATNLALGSESAQSGTAKDESGADAGRREDERDEEAKEKTKSSKMKRKANNMDEGIEANEGTLQKSAAGNVNATPHTIGNANDVQSTQNPQDKSPPVPRRLLRFAQVAELFIKLRRAQRRAATSALHFQRNALVVECCSGENPITHAGMISLLRESSSSSSEEGQDDVTVVTSPTQGLSSSTSLKEPITGLKRRARVELADTFNCVDGVDTSKLLRASRALLYERAEALLGVCVFVEESWTCSIYTHKHRHECGYRVQVRYSATSASPITANNNPQSPSRVAFPPNLPSISEGTEQSSMPDSPPSRSPPVSPSRKGKKRLSFTGNKSEVKAGSSVASPASPPSYPPTSSATTTDSISTPSASPTSSTFPSSSPGKQPRSPKSRAVSFAQPSVLSAVIADVRQPVQLDRARGVPGLMTIVSRETVEFVIAPVH